MDMRAVIGIALIVIGASAVVAASLNRGDPRSLFWNGLRQVQLGVLFLSGVMLSAGPTRDGASVVLSLTMATTLYLWWRSHRNAKRG